MLNVLLKACIRTSASLLRQKHLRRSINPLLNGEFDFSWVYTESSSMNTDLEINQRKNTHVMSFTISQQKFFTWWKTKNQDIDEAINNLKCQILWFQRQHHQLVTVLHMPNCCDLTSTLRNLHFWTSTKLGRSVSVWVKLRTSFPHHKDQLVLCSCPQAALQQLFWEPNPLRLPTGGDQER